MVRLLPIKLLLTAHSVQQTICKVLQKRNCVFSLFVSQNTKELLTMSTITVKADDGRKLEISKGSHVYLKNGKGENIYWEWEAIPTIQAELNKILTMSEDMLEQVGKLISAHPNLAVRY